MSVEVTTLANGLRVASDRMETVETATVGIYVGSGTRHEPAAVNGVAHLLEHMAFKGTRRRSAQAIAEEIEAVGGYLNAYTARENTAFYAKVLADDVPLAVDLLSDILQHSVLDPEELERERQVILQEINQADDTPDDVIFDHAQATAFPDQGVGRPVLGQAELVQHMPRAALVDFLADHYTGPNIVLSAAGKVDHAALVKLAEEGLCRLNEGAHAPEEPARYVGGEHHRERVLEQTHLVLALPAFSFNDPAYFAQSVYSMMLGGGMSSRLFQEIREKRGLCYSIYAFVSAFMDSGLFGIYVGTGPEKVDEVLALIADELLRSADQIDAAETERARAQLRASLLMAMESTTARAETLGQNLLIFGRPIPVAELQAKVEAVTADDLRDIAARLISQRPTLASLGPGRPSGGIERLSARFG